MKRKLSLQEALTKMKGKTRCDKADPNRELTNILLQEIEFGECDSYETIEREIARKYPQIWGYLSWIDRREIVIELYFLKYGSVGEVRP